MIEALLTVTLLLVSETKTYVRPLTAEAAYYPVEAPILPVEASLPSEPTIDLDTVERCNCWLYLRNQYFGEKMPFTKDIKENTTNAEVGAIAVFQYKTLRHYAYVKDIVSGGFIVAETNFKRCEYGERLVSWDDPAFLWFHNPHASPNTRHTSNPSI